MINEYEMHILWQDQNLHNKNAEKDQTGASDVVFKGRQGCCSVLKRSKTKQKLVRHHEKDSENLLQKFLNYTLRHHESMTCARFQGELQLVKPLTSFSKDLL